MREHITYNKVYDKFSKLTQNIRKFFAETVVNIEGILHSRINDNFQVIKHTPIPNIRLIEYVIHKLSSSDFNRK